jgi:hypothetical protein
MERITLSAKPSATDVSPYTLSVLPLRLSAIQIKNVIILGKSFFQIRNLYITGPDINYFDGLDYTYFDPFGDVPRLNEQNPAFYGVIIPNFTVINDNIKNGQYDLRTENIGIKPGNTFKAQFDE